MIDAPYPRVLKVTWVHGRRVSTVDFGPQHMVEFGYRFETVVYPSIQEYEPLISESRKEAFIRHKYFVKMIKKGYCPNELTKIEQEIEECYI